MPDAGDQQPEETALEPLRVEPAASPAIVPQVKPEQLVERLEAIQEAAESNNA